MLKRGLTLLVGLVTGGALIYLWLAVAVTGAAQPTALAAGQASVIQDAAASAPVIHYQGRLLDPSTGQPKPDGAYAMSFNLYTVNTGGAPLWTETKSVILSKGMFSTLLGDTTALNLGIFTSQELYLGVTVGADPESSPRQRIAHVAYAIHAENATSATTAGNADTLDAQDSTAFAPASHNHDGAAIGSGTVVEARIDPAMARDNEILPTVLAGDGAGSGLDADKLDGQEASAFAAASHNHDGAAISAGTVSEPHIDAAIARDNEVLAIVQSSGGSGSGIDADSVDGYDSASLMKGNSGVQINQTTPLAVTGQEYWFTFGYSPDQLVVWRVRPTTTAGKLRLEVESELGNDGNITYYLRVFNTGSVASAYQLIRTTFYQ